MLRQRAVNRLYYQMRYSSHEDLGTQLFGDNYVKCNFIEKNIEVLLLIQPLDRLPTTGSVPRISLRKESKV